MTAIPVRRSASPRSQEGYDLAVTADDDELVGFARLAFAGVKAVKRRYAIRADRWSKGYATDAALQIIAFDVEDLVAPHVRGAAVAPEVHE